MEAILAILVGGILGVIIAKLIGIPMPGFPQDWRTIKPVETAPETPRRQIYHGVSSGAIANTSSITDSLPYLMYPVGRPPVRWGPGARIPERRAGEYKYVQR